MAATQPAQARPGRRSRIPSPTPSVTVPSSDNPDLLEINLGPEPPVHPRRAAPGRRSSTARSWPACATELGYVHTGIEKNIEQKTYWKAITLRPADGLPVVLLGRLAFCMAVEKLLELEVPRAREYLRVIFDGAHPAALAPGLARHRLARPRRASSLFFYCFRERDYVLDLFEMVAGAAHAPALHPGRAALAEDIPLGFEPERARVLDECRGRIDEYEDLLTRTRSGASARSASACCRRRRDRSSAQSGPNVRASGVDLGPAQRDGRYGGYRELDLRCPCSAERRRVTTASGARPGDAPVRAI